MELKVILGFTAAAITVAAFVIAAVRRIARWSASVNERFENLEMALQARPQVKVSRVGLAVYRGTNKVIDVKEGQKGHLVSVKDGWLAWVLFEDAAEEVAIPLWLLERS